MTLILNQTVLKQGDIIIMSCSHIFECTINILTIDLTGKRESSVRCDMATLCFRKLWRNPNAIIYTFSSIIMFRTFIKLSSIRPSQSSRKLVCVHLICLPAWNPIFIPIFHCRSAFSIECQYMSSSLRKSAFHESI